MKIGVKLMGGFCLVAGLVALVGVIGTLGLNRMEESTRVILDQKVPVTDAAAQAVLALVSGHDAMARFLLTEDKAELEALEKNFQQTVSDFDRADQYIQGNGSEVAAAYAKETDEYHEKFKNNATKLIENHRDQLLAVAEMPELMAEFSRQVDELETGLVDYERDLTRARQIDEKVDASMEAKSIIFKQQAITEEYMGLDFLAGAEELRKAYQAKNNEFTALSGLLSDEIVAAQKKIAEMTLGKGGLFDRKDEVLHLMTEAEEHLALMEEYVTKGSLAMTKTEEQADSDMKAAMGIADSTHTSSTRLIIGFTGGAFLLAVGIGFLLGRSVSVPLGKAVQMIKNLEHGKLEHRLNMQRADEIGELAKSMDAFAENLQQEVLEAFKKLAEGDFTFEARGLIREPLAKANRSLNEVMTQIRVAGEQIASGSSQVSDSSQSLSQGATEQASSLEQITSSMTEMAAQTKTNAENANQANQLAGESRDGADKGNRQMQEMVAAMAEINEAGQNISKIIKVIDEIAFQTNLLALNAAVEAARAGKHGKGFAVVAEEVRNLAARSAKAARETAELIEGSVAKSENGTEIANQTAEALKEIVSSITKVTDLVGEIAAASNEQAQGISQVNEGLGQIDQVTQQNTANAEESAAAAEELTSQAMQMHNMLARFKLSTTTQGEYGAAAEPRIRRESAPAPAAPQLKLEDAPADRPETTDARPEEIIALDDHEFGKY